MTPGRSPISVRDETLGDVVVVSVSGELDVMTAEAFRDRVDAVLGDSPRHMVLDVRRVSFIDSTGLAALVSTQRRLTRARRRLALVHGPGGVDRALQVTRLDFTFDIQPDVESAVAAVTPVSTQA